MDFAQEVYDQCLLPVDAKSMHKDFFELSGPVDFYAKFGHTRITRCLCGLPANELLQRSWHSVLHRLPVTDVTSN